MATNSVDFFTSQLQKSGHEYILAGDEVVFGKAGSGTYGKGEVTKYAKWIFLPITNFHRLEPSVVHPPITRNNSPGVIYASITAAMASNGTTKPIKIFAQSAHNSKITSPIDLPACGVTIAAPK